jgi:hypothetical protein
VRATIEHPAENSNVVAHYGLNGALSWWCEVRASGRLVVEYDAITCGKPTTPAGILRVLVEHCFVTEDDISEAREWLAVVGEVEFITDDGARRAAEVIEKLKAAGGAG